MYMKQAYGHAAEAVGSTYFFLLSDAYREFREAEVRWECYATSQYHFDDGVTFVLEAVKPELPVDHPVWTMYSEKVAEVGARVAQADSRKIEKQAVLKGVHQGFVRFCRAKALDGGQDRRAGHRVPATPHGHARGHVGGRRRRDGRRHLPAARPGVGEALRRMSGPPRWTARECRTPATGRCAPSLRMPRRGTGS